MKRVWKTLFSSMLIVGVVCLLTACGPKFDASGYVKAALDADIHGESAEYAKLLEITEEEAQQEYEEVLDSMVSEMSDLGLSDELNDKYRTLFADLLKKTDYTVLEATENDDGSFTVPVEIKPITNVFSGLMDELEADMTEYANSLVDSGDIPNDDEITEYAGQLVYDMLAARLDAIEYGEAQTVEVTVALDEDNAYGVAEDDIEALLTTMIDLGDLA
ncbi:MAG: hypothetical protein Q4C40_04430 [Eubacteriales bacterium]|nr:hypothetical protein [Eubacteriales bacterium]